MEEPKGSIERLKNALYSRDGLQKHRARRTLRNWGTEAPVTTEWAPEPEAVAPPPALFPGLNTRSGPTLILFGSVVFFLVCLIVAFFFFLGGNNLISNKNIDIAVAGPVATAGGKEMSLQVTITNRNSVAIELADFIVAYPETARSGNDLSLPLGRTRESIGTLAPGESVNKTVRAVLFGTEGENQKLAMSLEYRVKGSNAIFTKDYSYAVVISSSPIALVVDGLSETTSGQPLTFTLEVISNSPTPVTGVMVRAEYPSGFTFDSATPDPTFDTALWQVGTLNPGEKKMITIKGRLYGENNEKRVFRFTPGVQSTKNERELQTVFAVVTEEVTLTVPFIGATMAVDGKAGTEFISSAGGNLATSIEITNNLPVQVLDPEIIVKISGSAFNELSVRATNGFYDSGTKSIRYTKEMSAALTDLTPGERRRFNFNLSPIDRQSGVFLTNPTLTFDVTVRGRRLGETRVSEILESTVVGTVKITTDLKLTARGVYTVGPFVNVGPLPPKVGVETTYTLLWTLTNGANDVTNGKVSATLPSYMRWVGAVSPEGTNLVYNPVSRVVTWNVGNVISKTGYERPASEIAFQVALVPSTSQINARVMLMGAPTFTGLDRFTNTTITALGKEVTTELVTDPAYKESERAVVP